MARCFYSNGVHFQIVQCFVECRLEVQLSLWVLTVPHQSPSHLVLALFRDLQQFDRMGHFLVRLN